MKPILLIHGYSSEGKSNTVDQIYGTLPAELRAAFGEDNVLDLNLSRWISLSDGVSIDDISFAMDRALRSKFPKLLTDGFHVVIHSTGALVVRNWIRNYSAKPCPIENLVHLAGANFGSGLAHIGQGQLARWGRFIFEGVGSGEKVLDALEFGSWFAIDLHHHFLQPGQDMRGDYQVQEFCIIGSEIPSSLRLIPIRYIREDSSDNTVRTSAGNLNFNYVTVSPRQEAYSLSVKALESLMQQRLNDETIDDQNYQFDLSQLSDARPAVPYSIAYETAHFGEEIGIVSGKNNRKAVVPLVTMALQTPYDSAAYSKVADQFEVAKQKTFARIGKKKVSLIGWNIHKQYEGHAQLIFRLRDQFGEGVKDFDITFKSHPKNKKQTTLESLIEDHHGNKEYSGTITYYLRTQQFIKDSKAWDEMLDDIAHVHMEITGHEDKSKDIAYVPVNVRLNPKQVAGMVKSFQTTIVDVELLRLPTQQVFAITKQ